MRNGKITLAYVALLVFFAALLLIFLVFIRNTFSSLDKDEVDCRNAILAHTLFSRRLAAAPEKAREKLRVETMPRISCAPREVLIDNERRDAGAKLVKELEFCWDRWQHGDVTLNTGKESTVVCNPCSNVFLENPDHPLTGITGALDAKAGKRRRALAVRLPDDCDGSALVRYPDSIPDNSVVLFVYARGEATQRLLQNDAITYNACEQPAWASLVAVGPNTAEFLTSLGCTETYQGMRGGGVEVLD